jgi:hypothetical protein
MLVWINNVYRYPYTCLQGIRLLLLRKDGLQGCANQNCWATCIQGTRKTQDIEKGKKTKEEMSLGDFFFLFDFI